MLTLLLASMMSLQQTACKLPGTSPTYDSEQQIECGWVTVPRSAGQPKTIRLWTARVKASGPNKQPDPIIFINGGPGYDTVDSLLPGLENWKLLAELRKDRDVIFYDQRGSGRSEEALCPTLAKSLADIEAAGLSPVESAARSRAAFANCRKLVQSNGGDLNAYTTLNSVADLDLIRRAYGATKVNHLSVSYGTLVAMHAMRAFPETVRSTILQSPYPPNSVAWAEQASSAASSYASIARSCSDQPDCRQQFGALAPKLEATLKALDKQPLRAGSSMISGRRFAKALWSLAVRTSTVRFVPEAIHRASAGDSELIKRLVEKFAGGANFGGYSPAQAFAIMCHEGGRTTAWFARARSNHPGLVTAELDDSWDQMCEAYRPGFADPSFFSPVASDIPTLIYTGSFDPATPVIDAYQATRFLTKATLVEVQGASHSPIAVDECTLQIGLAFLKAPDAPPDRECLAQRRKTAFPTQGLDIFLTPLAE